MIVLGDEADLFDQAPQRLGRFVTRAFGVERLAERLDLVAIGISASRGWSRAGGAGACLTSAASTLLRLERQRSPFMPWPPNQDHAVTVDRLNAKAPRGRRRMRPDQLAGCDFQLPLERFR